MTLLSLARKIVAEAEGAAANGAELTAVLPILRRLSLDDFGMLLISMPNSDYPGLSRILPRMPSTEVQKRFNARAGVHLFEQTASFARQLQSVFIQHTGRVLQDKKILELGVGWGRHMRSMLYFTDPANLWGVDPWQGSLNSAIEAGVPANLKLSNPIPETLPVGGEVFDLMFAHSVLTHLSEAAANAALTAVRKHISPNGLFVVTIRPVEYWSLRDQGFSAELGQKLHDQHVRTGFAFYAHSWSKDGSYGDASIEIDYLNRHGWKVVGYDTMLTSKYQISALLKPA